MLDLAVPPCAHLSACTQCRDHVQGAIATGIQAATAPGKSPAPSCPLTTRQLTVVALSAHGLTRVQAARRMYVSETTVRSHVVEALRRTGASNMAQLVALATRQGWIE